MNNVRNLLLFVAAISAGFVYICNAIPQIESKPAGEQASAESLDLCIFFAQPSAFPLCLLPFRLFLAPHA